MQLFFLKRFGVTDNSQSIIDPKFFRRPEKKKKKKKRVLWHVTPKSPRMENKDSLVEHTLRGVCKAVTQEVSSAFEAIIFFSDLKGQVRHLEMIIL